MSEKAKKEEVPKFSYKLSLDQPLSDLRPDDKLPPVFLWDFIVYQFGYGLKAIEIYKGQKYEKVKLRSVDEFMEEE